MMVDMGIQVKEKEKEGSMKVIAGHKGKVSSHRLYWRSILLLYSVLILKGVIQ